MHQNKTTQFPRPARLLRHADFERVYKRGRRHFSATITVFYWPRTPAEAGAEMRGGTRAKVPAQQKMTPSGLRIGFTVGRALGGAVERNRMKRRLREAVRIKRPLGGVAADVVINPKKAILATAFADVVKEVEKAFGVIEQRLAKELAREESKGSATKA